MIKDTLIVPNDDNKTIRQSATYTAIRGHFLEDRKWSRISPRKPPNFAEKVGF